MKHGSFALHLVQGRRLQFGIGSPFLNSHTNHRVRLTAGVAKRSHASRLARHHHFLRNTRMLSNPAETAKYASGPIRSTISRSFRGRAHTRTFFGWIRRIPDLLRKKTEPNLTSEYKKFQWPASPAVPSYHDLPDIVAAVEHVEARIGYEFKDKKLAVKALKNGYSVTSIQFENSIHEVGRNNYLALLGDRVLSLTLCQIWYRTGAPLKHYNDVLESMSSTVALSRRASELGLDKDLLGSTLSTRDAAETFEAILGAVFVDSNYSIEAVSHVLATTNPDALDGVNLLLRPPPNSNTEGVSKQIPRNKKPRVTPNRTSSPKTSKGDVRSSQRVFSMPESVKRSRMLYSDLFWERAISSTRDIMPRRRQKAILASYLWRLQTKRLDLAGRYGRMEKEAFGLTEEKSAETTKEPAEKSAGKSAEKLPPVQVPPQLQPFIGIHWQKSVACCSHLPESQRYVEIVRNYVQRLRNRRDCTALDCRALELLHAKLKRLQAEARKSTSTEDTTQNTSATEEHSTSLCNATTSDSSGSVVAGSHSAAPNSLGDMASSVTTLSTDETVKDSESQEKTVPKSSEDTSILRHGVTEELSSGETQSARTPSIVPATSDEDITNQPSALNTDEQDNDSQIEQLSTKSSKQTVTWALESRTSALSRDGQEGDPQAERPGEESSKQTTRWVPGTRIVARRIGQWRTRIISPPVATESRDNTREVKTRPVARNVVAKAYTPEQKSRMTAIASEAAGLDATLGDLLSSLKKHARRNQSDVDRPS